MCFANPFHESDQLRCTSTFQWSSMRFSCNTSRFEQVALDTISAPTPLVTLPRPAKLRKKNICCDWCRCWCWCRLAAAGCCYWCLFVVCCLFGSHETLMGEKPLRQRNLPVSSLANKLSVSSLPKMLPVSSSRKKLPVTSLPLDLGTFFGLRRDTCPSANNVSKTWVVCYFWITGRV